MLYLINTSFRLWALFFCIQSGVKSYGEDALDLTKSLIKSSKQDLNAKVMCGYQGWFSCKGDGAELGWKHYSGLKGILNSGNCSFDLWPDLSEMDDDEKYATDFNYKDGSTAHLFSSYHPKTVMRHFQWMQSYGIDGIFLQRFATQLKSSKHLNHCNAVMAHVREAAHRTERTWCVMYDLSGLKAGEIKNFVIEDWKRLIDQKKVCEDLTYQFHRNKPLVGVWGIGFNDQREYTLKECENLLHFLKHDPNYGGNAVLVGVPTGWQTLKRDAILDVELHRVLKLADVISPWTVGRYRTTADVQQHSQKVVKLDLSWCKQNELDYMPVAFPGFSWNNLQQQFGLDAKPQAIPRSKGEFLWSQAVNFKQQGASMLYIAMFDEIDEGTAIFKCINNPPANKIPFLTYEGLSSDYYLWLTGRISQMYKNKLIPTATIPLR